VAATSDGYSLSVSACPFVLRSRAAYDNRSGQAGPKASRSSAPASHGQKSPRNRAIPSKRRALLAPVADSTTCPTRKVRRPGKNKDQLDDDDQVVGLHRVGA